MDICYQSEYQGICLKSYLKGEKERGKKNIKKNKGEKIFFIKKKKEEGSMRKVKCP